MHEALTARACTTSKAREVAQIIEANTACLVDSESKQLLVKCSMAEVVERVRCAIESHECSLASFVARALATRTLAVAIRHVVNLLGMWKSPCQVNSMPILINGSCSFTADVVCMQNKCSTVSALQECGVCRLYGLGSKVSEGAIMAADASLSLERISQAMHAMFEMLSKPDVLPEFSSLQVSTGIGLAY